jgi:hypothetical protein
MSKRKWLFLAGIVCLIVLIAVVYPRRYLLFPMKGIPMDTTHWKTYCIGRFLIDLPPALTLTRDGIPGEIWGKPLVWRKDLTPEAARKEAAAEIDKWKKTENKKTKDSMFLGTVDLPNNGIAIVRWKETYSKEMLAFQSWFITPGPEPRIFSYTKGCDSDKQAACQKQIEYLASTLRTRDDWGPIPTEPGFCFDGGISVHTGAWRSERAGMYFQLPMYPGIDFAFSVWGMGIKNKTLFEDERPDGPWAEMRKGHHPNATVVRRGELTLGGGIPAQEIAFYAPPHADMGQYYSFTLKAASDGERFDRPELRFVMGNLNHWYDGKIPFRSTEEALGLWDAITRSIRLRPGAI